jgi:ERO1-like protein alpha
MCRLRDCSVCECPDNEFPEQFKKVYNGLSRDSMICQEGKPQAAVDKTLDSRIFKGWVETDNPWTNDDETDNGIYFCILYYSHTWAIVRSMFLLYYYH